MTETSGETPHQHGPSHQQLGVAAGAAAGDTAGGMTGISGETPYQQQRGPCGQQQKAEPTSVHPVRAGGGGGDQGGAAGGGRGRGMGEGAAAASVAAQSDAGQVEEKEEDFFSALSFLS